MGNKNTAKIHSKTCQSHIYQEKLKKQRVQSILVCELWSKICRNFNPSVFDTNNKKDTIFSTKMYSGSYIIKTKWN